MYNIDIALKFRVGLTPVVYILRFLRAAIHTTRLGHSDNDENKGNVHFRLLLFATALPVGLNKKKKEGRKRRPSAGSW